MLYSSQDVIEKEGKPYKQGLKGRCKIDTETANPRTRRRFKSVFEDAMVQLSSQLLLDSYSSVLRSCSCRVTPVHAIQKDDPMVIVKQQATCDSRESALPARARRRCHASSGRISMFSCCCAHLNPPNSSARSLVLCAPVQH